MNPHIVCRLIVIAAVIVLMSASVALACECASLDLARRADLADFILVGKVASHVPLERVTVTVVEGLEGPVSGTVTIATGRSDCDFFLPRVTPRVGDDYLLYLTRSEGVSASSPER